MNDKIAILLSSVRYATVSTVDSDGKPWAAPVWYVYDEQNLYWWSPLDSQHSKNIVANPEVYITIFDSSVPEGDGFGLYLRANTSELDGDELDSAIEMYNASTEVFKLTRENCTKDAPTRMYKAAISDKWVNDGTEQNGFYSDTRVGL